MKTKYIIPEFYKNYDEKMYDLLSTMNQKGYELTRIGFFFKFQKTYAKLKYQIDYSNRSTEFEETVKQLGYFYIGSYHHRHLYATNHLNAPDLITDTTLYQETLLKTYPSSSIIGLVLFAILISLTIGNYLYLFPHIGHVYLYFNTFVFCCILFGFLIELGILLCLFLLKRKSIKNNTYCYQKFKYMDFFNELYVFLLTITSIVILFLTNDSIKLGIFILCIFVSFIKMTALEHIIPTYKTKTKRTLITAILFAVDFVVLFTIHYFFNPNTSSPISNPFVEVETTTNYEAYHCINEDVATKVYESLLPITNNYHPVDSPFDLCHYTSVIMYVSGKPMDSGLYRYHFKQGNSIYITEMENEKEIEISSYESLIK